MLPYYHQYTSLPPMGYMPPPPRRAPLSSFSFVPPQQPIPFWDDHTYIYNQTLPPFVPPPPPPSPPPLPFWDNTCFYTQTLHPPSFPSPPSPSPSQSPLDLRNKILKQIEYYFSDDNLATDCYLKKHMDDNGWVPIALIAGFRRVSQLTKDIPLILFTMSYCSKTVEVERDKLRQRTTWKKWLARPDKLDESKKKAEGS